MTTDAALAASHRTTKRNGRSGNRHTASASSHSKKRGKKESAAAAVTTASSSSSSDDSSSPSSAEPSPASSPSPPPPSARHAMPSAAASTKSSSSPTNSPPVSLLSSSISERRKKSPAEAAGFSSATFAVKTGTSFSPRLVEHRQLDSSSSHPLDMKQAPVPMPRNESANVAPRAPFSPRPQSLLSRSLSQHQKSLSTRPKPALTSRQSQTPRRTSDIIVAKQQTPRLRPSSASPREDSKQPPPSAVVVTNSVAHHGTRAAALTAYQSSSQSSERRSSSSRLAAAAAAPPADRGNNPPAVASATHSSTSQQEHSPTVTVTSSAVPSAQTSTASSSASSKPKRFSALAPYREQNDEKTPSPSVPAAAPAGPHEPSTSSSGAGGNRPVVREARVIRGRGVGFPFRNNGIRSPPKRGRGGFLRGRGALIRGIRGRGGLRSGRGRTVPPIRAKLQQPAMDDSFGEVETIPIVPRSLCDPSYVPKSRRSAQAKQSRRKGAAEAAAAAAADGQYGIDPNNHDAYHHSRRNSSTSSSSTSSAGGSPNRSRNNSPAALRAAAGGTDGLLPPPCPLPPADLLGDATGGGGGGNGLVTDEKSTDVDHPANRFGVGGHHHHNQTAAFARTRARETSPAIASDQVFSRHTSSSHAHPSHSHAHAHMHAHHLQSQAPAPAGASHQQPRTGLPADMSLRRAQSAQQRVMNALMGPVRDLTASQGPIPSSHMPAEPLSPPSYPRPEDVEPREPFSGPYFGTLTARSRTGSLDPSVAKVASEYDGFASHYRIYGNSRDHLPAVQRGYTEYFMEPRHVYGREWEFEENVSGEITDKRLLEWRGGPKRIRTPHVGIALALNLEVTPPDVIREPPCATILGWKDLKEMAGTDGPKQAEEISVEVKRQYLACQPRLRVTSKADPTAAELEAVCKMLRRDAGRDRALLHYNGWGVPMPTPAGDVWAFDQNFTKYLPVPADRLLEWLGMPAFFVFDCNGAARVVNALSARMERVHNAEIAKDPSSAHMPPTSFAFGACGEDETLPTSNPMFPADLFTACLTTPLRMSLLWHQSQARIFRDMPLMSAPGRVGDRKTPAGELNWIFTSIADTIAWDVLPRPLFQRLFRQDLLSACLWRNFLLADRLMRKLGRTPVSYPEIPHTHKHRMWDEWDLVLEDAMGQFGRLRNVVNEYRPSPFFHDKLTAFEVWLELGTSRRPPVELPIVLQILLSQSQRLRALKLLARFMDKGSWAVQLALSVGIHPYVSKLLSTFGQEIRPVLVYIWTKILTVEKECRVELAKVGVNTPHQRLVGYLRTPDVSYLQLAMTLFSVATIARHYEPGHRAVINDGIFDVLRPLLKSKSALVRQWTLLCYSVLWEGFRDAKVIAALDPKKLLEQIVKMISDGDSPDPVCEVRASAAYALHTLFAVPNLPQQQVGPDGTLVAYTDEELRVADILAHNDLWLAQEMARREHASPLVRMEVILALSALIFNDLENFAYLRQNRAPPKVPSPYVSGTSSQTRMPRQASQHLQTHAQSHAQGLPQAQAHARPSAFSGAVHPSHAHQQHAQQQRGGGGGGVPQTMYAALRRDNSLMNANLAAKANGGGQPVNAKGGAVLLPKITAEPSQALSEALTAVMTLPKNLHEKNNKMRRYILTQRIRQLMRNDPLHHVQQDAAFIYDHLGMYELPEAKAKPKREKEAREEEKASAATKATSTKAKRSSRVGMSEHERKHNSSPAPRPEERKATTSLAAPPPVQQQQQPPPRKSTLTRGAPAQHNLAALAAATPIPGRSDAAQPAVVGGGLKKVKRMHNMNSVLNPPLQKKKHHKSSQNLSALAAAADAPSHSAAASSSSFPPSTPKSRQQARSKATKAAAAAQPSKKKSIDKAGEEIGSVAALIRNEGGVPGRVRAGDYHPSDARHHDATWKVPPSRYFDWSALYFKGPLMSYDHNQNERLRPVDHSDGDRLYVPAGGGPVAQNFDPQPVRAGGRCSYAPPPPPSYNDKTYLTVEDAMKAIEKDDVGTREQLVAIRDTILDASAKEYREHNAQLVSGRNVMPREIFRTMRALPESPPRPWDVTDDFHEFEPSQISRGEVIPRLGLLGPAGMVRQSSGGTGSSSSSSGNSKSRGGFFGSSSSSSSSSSTGKSRLRLSWKSSKSKSSSNGSGSGGLTGRNRSSSGDEYDNFDADGEQRRESVGNVSEAVEPGVPFGAPNDERARLKWLLPGEVVGGYTADGMRTAADVGYRASEDAIRVRKTKFFAVAEGYRERKEVRRIKKEVANFRADSDHLSRVVFHSYESFVVGADKEKIYVWDVNRGRHLNTFKNGNRRDAPISDMCMINEDASSSVMMMCASDDAVIRIWRDIHEPERRRLCTAFVYSSSMNWKEYSFNNMSKHRVLLDWKQRAGRLLIGGASEYVEAWDANVEKTVRRVEVGTPSGVFSMCTERESDGRTFYVGCGDGTVRVFDLREKTSLVVTKAVHRNGPKQDNRVVKVHAVSPKEILSASSVGEICVSSTSQIDNATIMSDTGFGGSQQVLDAATIGDNSAFPSSSIGSGFGASSIGGGFGASPMFGRSASAHGDGAETSVIGQSYGMSFKKSARSIETPLAMKLGLGGSNASVLQPTMTANVKSWQMEEVGRMRQLHQKNTMDFLVVHDYLPMFATASRQGSTVKFFQRDGTRHSHVNTTLHQPRGMTLSAGRGNVTDLAFHRFRPMLAAATNSGTVTVVSGERPRGDVDEAVFHRPLTAHWCSPESYESYRGGL